MKIQCHIVHIIFRHQNQWAHLFMTEKSRIASSSDNMQNSIERWKRAYGQVTEKEIKKLEMEKALKKLLEDFFYVWNFRVLDTAFVREFLKHKNDDRYKRAMIVLIELMDKETKYFPELTKREANIWLIREIRDADEMIEINAYLGMLRHHLRRKEILGF